MFQLPKALNPVEPSFMKNLGPEKTGNQSLCQEVVDFKGVYFTGKGGNYRLRP